jgi:enterochelin esterase-like enzyme
MPTGRIVVERFSSEVLKGNLLGDPHERDVHVYLPPRYDEEKNRRYPVIYGIAGFTGTGRALLNYDTLGEDLKTKVDRLISTRKAPPMILVLVDCFTRLGGSQYINSTATGRYEDYIIEEMVPFIDSRYRCGGRAIWGKSSGGYGSFVLGMRHPDVFSALADHSGDALFEYCYPSDFPKALDAFREAGSPARWLKRFWEKPNRRQAKDQPVLNTLAMAAHYSPNPKSRTMGIDFPFDLQTGEWRQEVWQRWLEWDPVRMVEKYADNLRRLKLVYIDCGTKDEFNLHWGARVLHAKLTKLGIRHFYEEFDDGHFNIAYRYDLSLPMLSRALMS